MDVPLNVPVECSDGLGGHSTTLLLNPVSDEMTHVIVREEGLLGIEVMVPIDKVMESTPDSIRLSCTRAELHAMEPFKAVEYVQSGPEIEASLGGSIVFWPYVTYDTEEIPHTYENVPQGQFTIHRGTEVEASDGRVGKVGEFLIDADNHITHLVLREGLLWDKKDVTIPVAEIDRFEDDVVHLKLTREQVKELPSIPLRRGKLA